MKKYKKAIFFLLVCLTAQTAYSFRHIELPDTFHIVKANVDFFEDISSMREYIRDSIDNPKAYLILNYFRVPVIAIKKEDKYAIIFFDDDGFFRNYEFDRKNTNDKKLVVRWNFSWGRSRWEGGGQDSSTGILIWNIDTYELLLDFQDMRELETWWQIFDPETEDLDYWEREVIESGRITECYKFAVELEKKRLTIQLIKDSEDGECIEVVGTKHFYKLTEAGFVRYKIEE